MMKSEIQIHVKSAYGRDFYYPNCKHSEMLCELMEQTTFTLDQLKILKRYEYEMNFLLDPKTKNPFEKVKK